MAGDEGPGHAEIPKKEGVFLGDTEPISSPMKAKRGGEVGPCGGSAAIAQPGDKATGIRGREYPITPDKMR
ncbi:hypothetical protein, partial [Escherichia coli]|uniref:hypothetical protein n=1 Tax=Escherichia coli TaxID=562 RepID=UPI001BC863FD